MIATLARVPLARISRTPRAWLPLVAWGAFAVASAAAGRPRSPAGMDAVLTSSFGGLALPLLALAALSAVLGGESLRGASLPLLRFGAPAVASALAHVLVALGLAAVLGALFAAGVVLVGAPALGSPVLRDAATSAYVGALGGAAYASAFALGATFGKRGGGRVAVLFFDFLVGSGSEGGAAMFLPRGHVANLLGDTSGFEMPQRASAITLVLLAGTYALIAIRRAAR